MDENLREVTINLGYDSMTIELDQGAMSEDEFIEYAIDYVLRNISIEVN